MDKRQVLLTMSVEELGRLFPSYPKYTAKQINSFLWDGKSIAEMTSLSKAARAELKEGYIANPVEILEVYKGKSGAKKYLFKLTDGNLIEGVYMPHNYGNTLCLSTQIGCRMGCSFCASGLDGLLRSLTVAEMAGQVVAVNRAEGGTAKARAVKNLVLMGSGEPFDNYDNVLSFLDVISGEESLNISERNISLSTSGLADKVRKFADSGHKVTLSISLHAPNDALRSQIMPINRAFGVQELVDAAKYYFEKTGRRVIYEYTLIKGVNDTDECLRQLASLARGFSCHVNLIRLNEVKETALKAPAEDAVEAFRGKLERLGVSATIRRSLGGDIEGACGQLRRRYIENH